MPNNIVTMLAPSGFTGSVSCNVSTPPTSGQTYTPDSNGFASVDPRDVAFLVRVGFSVVPGEDGKRNNLTATTDPLATSDSASDYAVGSTWLNVSSGKSWVCVDATASAAVWIQTGPGTGTFGLGLPLVSGRTPTGLVLDATGGAGLFSISSTVGTLLALLGEAANSNTKTDDVLFELVLPKTYVAARNVTATVEAKLVGAGTPGTKTLAVKAYKVAADGTQSVNLGPVAQAIVAAGSVLSFVITGATLNPGDKLLLELESVLQETAASALQVQIGAVNLA